MNGDALQQYERDAQLLYIRERLEEMLTQLSEHGEDAGADHHDGLDGYFSWQVDTVRNTLTIKWEPADLGRKHTLTWHLDGPCEEIREIHGTEYMRDEQGRVWREKAIRENSQDFALTSYRDLDEVERVLNTNSEGEHYATYTNYGPEES